MYVPHSGSPGSPTSSPVSTSIQSSMMERSYCSRMESQSRWPGTRGLISISSHSSSLVHPDLDVVAAVGQFQGVQAPSVPNSVASPAWAAVTLTGGET